jgi:hypothetical protein
VLARWISLPSLNGLAEPPSARDFISYLRITET